MGWRARHVFGVLGLRPAIAEHTLGEAELLRRCAQGAKCAVEIGVAEGGSAWEVRQVLDPQGELYLIDPYPPGALRVSMARLVARRLVGRVRRGRVVWIRATSEAASSAWSREIDFLFIDADHSFDAVLADWRRWTPHVCENGVVALHDSAVGEGLWTNSDDGPVRLVQMLEADQSEWQLLDRADTTVVLGRKSAKPATGGVSLPGSVALER
jgi:predicted O-methyltransferase YrrM